MVSVTVFLSAGAVLSSIKSIDEAEATKSSPPSISTYALFSIAETSISKLDPVPPILAAFAETVSPTAYPVPPRLKSTSVTCPAVTVISAYAPVPTPVKVVNATNSYVSDPPAGVYPEPPVMLALSTLVSTPYRASVTAPCAFPSVLDTIVLTVPVAATLPISDPVFGIVNVFGVGVEITSAFTVNVGLEVQIT